MSRIALLLEYDGACFAGWQRQREGQPTVQGALEEALERVCDSAAGVVGAGRTDAGVHAWGQVASASVDTRLDPEALWRALNGVLPRAVAIRALAPMPDAFHALRDAVAKHYVYRWWPGPPRSPLRARDHHCLASAVDTGAMRAAAGHFVGRHDFASLQAAGSSATTSVRTLHRVELREMGDGSLRLDVEGDGFLRHMVRNLAGTLLEVGQGRRPPGTIPALLERRDRGAAGPTAPAAGLLLLAVRYDPPISWAVGRACDAGPLPA